MPFPAIVPAIAASGGACTRPRMKHVPDKRAAIAGVLSLDGNSQPASPARHGALGARLGQRHHDGLNDLLRTMRGGHGNRGARL